MSHLASLDGGSANSEQIAERIRVPQGYFSKVMRALVCAGLVRSFRGPNGGFLLAKAPAAVSLLDIVNAVKPIRRIERCPLGDPSHLSLCPLHKCLDDAIDDVESACRRTTLEMLLRGVAEHDGCKRLIPQRVRPPA